MYKRQVVRGGKSPVDYFNKYKNRFTLLHIKDNRELGQSGMVGFDAIFNNTDAAGVKHLVVEVEQYSFTPEESVKKSLDSVSYTHLDVYKRQLLHRVK